MNKIERLAGNSQFGNGASPIRPLAFDSKDSFGILRSALRFSFHSVGGLNLIRMLSRSATRILMYHRFSENTQNFRYQCRHIANNYSVVNLGELYDARLSGQPLPRNAAVITIDDGYRDFYLYAWPVLQEFGLTATVFLISDFMDRRIWLWGDQIEYVAARCTTPKIEVSLLDGSMVFLELDTIEKRCSSVWRLKNALKRVPAHLAGQFMKELADQLEVRIPEVVPPEYEPLRWDEVRAMNKAGIEFGAHTRTHPILTRVEDPDDLRNEIYGCKVQLESHLDAPVRHFCYPNGDFDERSVALVRESGYDTAVTTELGLNQVDTDALHLRRIGVEPYFLPTTFRHFMAGPVGNVLGRS